MQTYTSRELASTAPELFVPCVEAAIRFYTEKLGFELLRSEQGDVLGRRQTSFAVIALEGSVILIAHEGFYAGMGGRLAEPRGTAIDIRIMVRDVDAVYRRARDNGVAIVHDIANRDYGLRDFVIRDPWGFRLRFAASVG